MRSVSVPIVSLALVMALGAIGCGHSPMGRLEYSTVASKAENRPMRYGLYLPPGWDRSTPLPIVLLLHGAGDDETAADREAVVSRFDAAVAAGELPPFILVAPDGERGMWVNWHNGRHRYRDWVLDEAVPDVRRRFPTVPGAAGLHLVGVSMGGGGGMQLWLTDPARFASATLLSAPILDTEGTLAFLDRFMSEKQFLAVFGPPGEGGGTDPYAALGAPADLKGSRLIFGAASNDIGSVLDSHRAFHAHLAGRDIPHRFVEFAGWHRWTSWAPMFVYALCHQLRSSCAMQPPDGWSVEAVSPAVSTVAPPGG